MRRRVDLPEAARSLPASGTPMSEHVVDMGVPIDACDYVRVAEQQLLHLIAEYALAGRLRAGGRVVHRRQGVVAEEHHQVVPRLLRCEVHHARVFEFALSSAVSQFS